MKTKLERIRYDIVVVWSTTIIRRKACAVQSFLGVCTMGYQIITDSGCDLSKEILAQLGVNTVPLTVNFRGEAREDSVDEGIQEIYNGLRAGEAASTSAAARCTISFSTCSIKFICSSSSTTFCTSSINCCRCPCTEVIPLSCVI